MFIQQLIEWDKELLLALNGSNSIYWDNFMMIHTGTLVWIPFFLALVYIIIRCNKWKESLLIIGMIGLVVALADGISSGICKPYFHRFRPTHDPSIMELVKVVNDYRGGMYGFVSSHASNAIGIATFLSLLFKRRELTTGLYFWAVLHCYTRIYLGVHFPGDILCGSILGFVVACLVYQLYKCILQRFMHENYSHAIVQRNNKYKKADAWIVLSIMGLTYAGILITSFF